MHEPNTAYARHTAEARQAEIAIIFRNAVITLRLICGNGF